MTTVRDPGAGTPLDTHLHAFVRTLRERGMAIGPGEAITAAEVLTVLDLTDRGQLREGLAAVLLREQMHRKTFDVIFDLYFPVRGGFGAAGTAPDGASGSGGEGCSGAPGEAPDQVDPLKMPAADTPPDPDAVREALRQEAVAALVAGGDHDGIASQIVEQLGEYNSATGTAFSSYQALKALNPQTLIAAIANGLLAAAGEEGAAPGSFEYESARRVARSRVAGLTERVTELTSVAMAARRGPEAVAQYAAPQLPENVAFFAATRTELHRMEQTVRPLARQLSTRLLVRRRRARRGPIDLRRTLRKSMSTGGVPIDLAHRRPRPTKPELVLLCDLSGSVAGFSNFTLLLTHALSAEFSKIRVFGFVDSVDEITDYIDPSRTLTVDTVVDMFDRVIRETNVARFGGSDYGNVLRTFVRDFPDAVTHRGTLLILGDARSNHTDPALAELDELVDKARHAFWLNPERRASWGTGDSVADKYGRLIDMYECRTAGQLAEVIGRLLPV
ncbi:VWA domain-containing protein [Tsukamurella tyrosinosolvens]|uniref:vWA domain-containing protein n=1 Tax=Tsukamurella tyrosinosolvens TaxID=57704 RepID=UPI001AFB48D9|nr:VWA domain-containing protein [Tsukamurella tyrosinosolvens]QRY84048.1 VWA domain-containing protein [Tsukamurella tyrosinosolvens]